MTREAAVVLAGNARWMWWNLVLALVPLTLAVVLFGAGRVRERTTGWWLGVVGFVLFLPNAPYVMTDVKHLFTDVRMVDSDAVLSLAVLPQYVLFIMAGVASYTACLLLVRGFVGSAAMRRLEPALHALCALGIYMGRVARLNSWDIVLHPAKVVQSGLASVSLANGLTLATVFCTLYLVTEVAKRLWAARAVLIGGMRSSSS